MSLSSLFQFDPFKPVESPEAARRLARASAWGHALWAGTGLAQAVVATRLLAAPSDDSAVGFAVLTAFLAAGLAALQWTRPNRIAPIFGLAWMAYELSASVVALLVGQPVGTMNLPAWAGAGVVIMAVLCLALHGAGLRGAAAVKRD